MLKIERLKQMDWMYILNNDLVVSITCTGILNDNKTDRRDITEILLEVALNTKTLPYPTL